MAFWQTMLPQCPNSGMLHIPAVPQLSLAIRVPLNNMLKHKCIQRFVLNENLSNMLETVQVFTSRPRQSPLQIHLS